MFFSRTFGFQSVSELPKYKKTGSASSARSSHKSYVELKGTYVDPRVPTRCCNGHNFNIFASLIFIGFLEPQLLALIIAEICLYSRLVEELFFGPQDRSSDSINGPFYL